MPTKTIHLYYCTPKSVGARMITVGKNVDSRSVSNQPKIFLEIKPLEIENTSFVH